ncbi:MAG: hypothetical protein ACR2IB_07040 [Pyrinomonadaceae bacterium]
MSVRESGRGLKMLLAPRAPAEFITGIWAGSVYPFGIRKVTISYV